MITKMTAYQSSDGKVVGSIEDVQKHELALIQSDGDVEKLPDVAKIVIATFVANRDKVVDILTTGPKSRPIDRINNYGNYEPGNVRWATGKVQSNNRRTNRLVTVSGKTTSVTTMARAYGISSTAVFGRLDAGWNAELAFTTPVSKATNPTGINGGTKKRTPRAPGTGLAAGVTTELPRPLTTTEKLK